MRVPETPEMRKMREQFEPYMVYKGLEATMAENTPEEIRKMRDEYLRLDKERYKEAWDYFNPELPLPED